MVDLHRGTIQLVIDGVSRPIAFGSGALAFGLEEQERQRLLITQKILLPMFSLIEAESSMTVNFGQSAFVNTANATPMNLIHQHISTKGVLLLIQV